VSFSSTLGVPGNTRQTSHQTFRASLHAYTAFTITKTIAKNQPLCRTCDSEGSFWSQRGQSNNAGQQTRGNPIARMDACGNTNQTIAVENTDATPAGSTAHHMNAQTVPSHSSTRRNKAHTQGVTPFAADSTITLTVSLCFQNEYTSVVRGSMCKPSEYDTTVDWTSLSPRLQNQHRQCKPRARRTSPSPGFLLWIAFYSSRSNRRFLSFFSFLDFFCDTSVVAS
jgi:hypothetical protein